MARPQFYDIDLPDVDPNGIAEDQTTVGAGNLTLDGALSDLGTAGQFDIGDSYSSGVGGVRISLESAGNLSGVVFTVTGLDQNGQVATEAITGPNATTVESTTYWSQITQIAVDGAVGTNVEVGTVDEIATKAYPLNHYADEAATVAVEGLVGTIQFDIQESFSDMSLGYSAINWQNSLSNQTADVAGNLTSHAAATRLIVDSYSSGAELQFSVHQNG